MFPTYSRAIKIAQPWTLPRETPAEYVHEYNKRRLGRIPVLVTTLLSMVFQYSHDIFRLTENTVEYAEERRLCYTNHIVKISDRSGMLRPQYSSIPLPKSSRGRVPFSSRTAVGNYSSTLKSLGIGRHTRVIFQGFTGTSSCAANALGLAK